MREVKAGLLGRGLSVVSDGGREWNVTQPLCVGDTLLVADLQR